MPVRPQLRAAGAVGLRCESGVAVGQACHHVSRRELFNRRTPLAPDLGEHNREVLSRLLGLTDADLDQLEADGVIGYAPPAGP